MSEIIENEMILAFLKAEIDSPRWGQYYLAILSDRGLNKNKIIDCADLSRSEHNIFRAELLGSVRGYGKNDSLFRGFPSDTKWRRTQMSIQNFSGLKYAKFKTWIDLTKGTRLVVDGARNVDLTQVDENANAHIKAVTNLLKNGKRYPDLIAVEGDNGFFILVEQEGVSP